MTITLVGLIVAYLKGLAFSRAVRITMFDVQSPTMVGESLHLTCSYETDNEQLYSVRWYKDNVEFYRFLPQEWPQVKFLPLPGVRVDLSKSGGSAIYLRDVDLDTAGMYTCQVSTESSVHNCVQEKKELEVVVPPLEGPVITGDQPKYKVGDNVSTVCASSKSKPVSVLKWYINDKMVGEEESPYSTDYSVTLHPDRLETSTLSLQFSLNPESVKNNKLKLKCTASFSNVVTMVTKEIPVEGLQQSSSFKKQHETDKVINGIGTLRNSAMMVAIVMTLVQFIKI